MHLNGWKKWQRECLFHCDAVQWYSSSESGPGFHEEQERSGWEKEERQSTWCGGELSVALLRNVIRNGGFSNTSPLTFHQTTFFYSIWTLLLELPGLFCPPLWLDAVFISVLDTRCRKLRWITPQQYSMQSTGLKGLFTAGTHLSVICDPLSICTHLNADMQKNESWQTAISLLPCVLPQTSQIHMHTHIGINNNCPKKDAQTNEYSTAWTACLCEKEASNIKLLRIVNEKLSGILYCLNICKCFRFHDSFFCITDKTSLRAAGYQKAFHSTSFPLETFLNVYRLRYAAIRILPWYWLA